MKILHTAPIAAALTLLAMPVAAQTTQHTKVTHDTSVDHGVATTKSKVVQVHKHKTHHAKRILGVKVGHKTRKTKVVKETSRSTNGDHSTTVKTSH